jgi:PAS domain S-box-containing protein
MTAERQDDLELLSLEELRLELEEARETLRAIRSGEVDSLVVDGPNGPRVYALEGTNNSYRILVESMNEGAVILAANGTVLFCNLRFAEMLGLPLEKVMGGLLRDFVASEQLEWFDALVRSGWREPTKNEMKLRREDGTLLTVHLSLNPMADAEPVLCVVVTDLTEHIRVRELRESERRAVARSAVLQETDRRKDEFLGMLSHELRNPLAPIRNSAYILKHADPAGEQAARARAVIERQAEHLTRLVDDLLDVTRISRGKIELRRSRVDLREVVHRAAEDLRPQMDDRGIVFRSALPDGSVPADVDTTRITQLVGNLLHNAAKFTPRGGEVTLTLTVADGEAVVVVRDTGAGVDPALLPTIFEPFVQADRTLARTEGGLGLGLALVKAIAEMHGGSVHAASAGTGSGAEFTVRLRLLTALEPDTHREASARAGARQNVVRRVLVVDDNPDAAESLAEVIRMLGHSVEVAFDARSAIQVAKATRPDMVLCDIGMPGMDGYEVAKALRAAAIDGMQIVAVSGYAQPQDVKKSIEAGFNAHVAKPPDLAEIERLLA